jgi:hypothetical protein
MNTALLFIVHLLVKPQYAGGAALAEGVAEKP